MNSENIFTYVYIPTDIICMSFIRAGKMETKVKPDSVHIAVHKTQL